MGVLTAHPTSEDGSPVRLGSEARHIAGLFLTEHADVHTLGNHFTVHSGQQVGA